MFVILSYRADEGVDGIITSPDPTGLIVDPDEPPTSVPYKTDDAGHMLFYTYSDADTFAKENMAFDYQIINIGIRGGNLGG